MDLVMQLPNELQNIIINKLDIDTRMQAGLVRRIPKNDYRYSLLKNVARSQDITSEYFRPSFLSYHDKSYGVFVDLGLYKIRELYNPFYGEFSTCYVENSKNAEFHYCTRFRSSQSQFVTLS